MNQVITSALCLARPCVLLSCNANHTFADESCPQEHQLKSPKGFHCHLGEHHYSSVIILSPLTNQVTQTQMLSNISVSQM